MCSDLSISLQNHFVLCDGFTGAALTGDSGHVALLTSAPQCPDQEVSHLPQDRCSGSALENIF